MTDKALDKAKELLAMYPDRWDTVYVACWTAVDKKSGAETGQAYSRGAACHGGITRQSAGKYVINAHKPNFQGKYPEFTKWMCQQSPFSHGIINRDNENEILGQGIIIDGDEVGSAGVLWLAKGLRYTVEDQYRIPVWLTLQEAGLDPLQAFIGCSILDSTGAPQVGRTHCGLFRYDTPNNLYSYYQELLKEKKRGGDGASRPDSWSVWSGKPWGNLGYKIVKKSDGWGGFTEVKEPADPTEFVDKLKMIFAGDYKNVS